MKFIAPAHVPSLLPRALRRRWAHSRPMRISLRPWVAAACALGLLSACATTQPLLHEASSVMATDPRSAALAAYGEAMSMAVQGELRDALPRLRQLDANALDAERRHTVQDVLA